MPANQMKVNTSMISDSSKSIKNGADKFKTTYGSVFSQFSKIDAAWDGDDNAEFNSRVKSFRKDFEVMDDFFEKLIAFLNKAKEDYESAERDTLNASKRLAK